MNTRRIVGISFLLLAVGIVTYSELIRRRVNDAFQNAKNEVLLTADGGKVGKAGEFRVSYIHSHGTVVVNAEPVFHGEIDSANVQLIRGDEVVSLRFKNGATTRGGGPFGSTNVVVVQSPFDGDMLFKYGVCGCENLGPQILVLIAIGLGFIFTLIGLALIMKRGGSSLNNS